MLLPGNKSRAWSYKSKEGTSLKPMRRRGLHVDAPWVRVQAMSRIAILHLRRLWLDWQGDDHFGPRAVGLDIDAAPVFSDHGVRGS